MDAELSATILVVDPDPSTLAPLLERADVVVSSPSISHALIAIRQYRPSVVIAEYRLSDGSGLELIAHVKSKSPGTLPVMVTAAGSERICAAAFRLGAAAYLIKPVSPKELIDSIQRVLRKASAGRRSTNAFDQEPSGKRDGVRQAAQILERHYNDPVSLQKLAEAVGMSRFELSRQFSRTMGRSIRAYIAERRIARAKELLLTERPITEISQTIGYSDLPRFDKVFRALTGSSPSQFRCTAKSDKSSTKNY